MTISYTVIIFIMLPMQSEIKADTRQTTQGNFLKFQKKIFKIKILNKKKAVRLHRIVFLIQTRIRFLIQKQCLK